jgi:phosphoribosylformimino-5-aminoimidazole carboxamide ribotide isomerase
MRFEVIPAIDVAGGRLAQMTVGGPVEVDAFGGEPLAAARAFAAAGAERIHVVDMDRALAGSPMNSALLRQIAEIGVRVQASGGLATAGDVERALEAGATRAVLGSAGLLDRNGAGALIENYGEALVVGIEADGARIAPRGVEGAELPLWETLQWLSELKVARFLHTEVGRIGGLGGPDLDGAWALAKSTGRPVIASGGIRNLEDLRAVAGLGAGIEGAIVGRALYEGLDLHSALAAFT